jgi:hypothetical protein
VENIYWRESKGNYIVYYGWVKHLSVMYRKMIQSNYREERITATVEMKCQIGEA